MNRSTKTQSTAGDGNGPADNPPSLSDLSPAQLERCDHWADEFESRWRASPDYRIENYLEQLSPDDAELVLPELITVEIDLRHSHGDSIDPAEYAQRFPQHLSAIQRAVARLQAARDAPRQESTLSPQDVPIDDEPPPELPEIWARFRVGNLVGEGSFGFVFRATDCESGEVVALKFPRREALRSSQGLARFLAEAEHAQRLAHPRIVRTWGTVQHAGLVAIVQQFIDGSDLKTQLRQPRTHLESVRLVEVVADALAYAHQQGIYHRDLKPANILIDRHGQPHIADFGLALDERQQLSLPRQYCGTPAYMPPEQVAGLTRLLDGRSDIWSLGVILYELLTRRRPFAGNSDSQVLKQIESKDPRPLRQIDATIDKELQRICLKCLARHQRDRYPAADELADDLRQWAAHPGASPPSVQQHVAIVPKGLRSYSAEDAPFFLQLLPGPRDRFGLPASIRFWRSRIDEPVAAENRVPVGVLFGPSGSGKSSFVKAGLLPQLSREVLTVFVEATQADDDSVDSPGATSAEIDTEVRLLKALRQRLPNVPEEISLPDLLRQIAAGELFTGGHRKLLIVLDQFEQRLNQPGSFDNSQLARALRFCDGVRLQCLVLVRDDFLMSLARFADALEMDVREGENAQAIDLFDRRHAKFVLTELGRAYRCLPPETEPLTSDQEIFLERAIEQLAEQEYVVCVRLALFAEMFRQLPWTPAELRRMGGVAGTGERFLQATFGAESRNKKYRDLNEPAQRVLERLLPAGGTDIRGAICRIDDLRTAAQLESAPEQFEQLLNVLDAELRVITRTDRYLSNATGAAAAPSSETATWYQLTHDYLVPSVRGWLDSVLRGTRAGRAKIRLRDLAAQVVPGQPPRNLPTHWEYLSWQFLLPQRDGEPKARVVLAAARRRFWQQAGLALAVGLAACGVGGYLYLQQRAHQLVADLMGQEIESVPGLVAQITANPLLVRSKLQAIAAAPKLASNDRIRIGMALYPTDPRQEPSLLEAILQPDCPPAQLKAIGQVLQSQGHRSCPQLVAALDDSELDPRSRFRAACAEIFLGNSTRRWENDAELIATVLWNEPPTYLDAWVKILQAQGSQFAAKVDAMIRKPDDPDSQYFLEPHQALALAEANYSFKTEAERVPNLAGLIPAANDVRFDAILSTIEKHQSGAAMLEALQQIAATSQDATGQDHLGAAGQARLGLAHARLGQPAEILRLYRGDFTSLPTFLAINFSTASHIRLRDLQNLYEVNDLDRTAPADDSDQVNLRRALLQALALQTGKWLEPQQREWLAARARHHVLNDPDACCFSTAELIMRRLESDSLLTLRMARRKQKQYDQDIPFGNVMINHIGRPFSILKIPPQEGVAKVLAVSTCEVTFGELDYYRKSQGLSPIFQDKSPEMPFHEFRLDKGLELVAQYCNWLNNDPTWVNNARFYAEPVSASDMYDAKYDPADHGYRLPTTEEWRAFSQSNQVMEGLQELWPRPATKYAWTFENAQHSAHEVGHLLPNAAGLFDTFANVTEVCHTLKPGSEMLVSIGYMWRSGSVALKVSDGNPSYIAAISPLERLLDGYRIVRTLRPN